MNIAVIGGAIFEPFKEMTTKEGRKYLSGQIVKSNNYKKDDEWVKVKPTYFSVQVWNERLFEQFLNLETKKQFYILGEISFYEALSKQQERIKYTNIIAREIIDYKISEMYEFLKKKPQLGYQGEDVYTPNTEKQDDDLPF